MITCIDLDMDGVLVDFLGAVTKVLPQADISQYSLGLHPKALNNIMHKNRLWWANLEWTVHGQALFNACIESALPVLIMTQPADACSAAGKIDWLEKHCGPGQRYSLTTSKHHLARPGSLLIDDNQRHCEAYTQHGGSAFLWPAPYNRYARFPTLGDVAIIKETLSCLAG